MGNVFFLTATSMLVSFELLIKNGLNALTRVRLSQLALFHWKVAEDAKIIRTQMAQQQSMQVTLVLTSVYNEAVLPGCGDFKVSQDK